MKGKPGISILIIFFLCGLAGFSVYRYVAVNVDLGHNKRQLAELEERNTAVNEELGRQKLRLEEAARQRIALEAQVSEGKKNLEQLKQELTDNRQEFTGLQKAIEELTQINQVLSQEQKVLQAKTEELSSQKSVLEAKISSVDELKQMLKDLIRLKKNERRKKITSKETIVKEELKNGNRGYIIYHGMPTLKSRSSIEVIPVN